MHPRDWALLGLLAYMPFSTILDSWFPLRILNYSGFVTVIPTMFAIAIYLVIVIKQGQKFVYLPFFMAILAAFVVGCRQLLIERSPSLDGALNAVRYIVLVPVYLVLWRMTIRNQTLADWTRRIILVGGLMMAVFGVLHDFGLPTFYAPVSNDVELTAYDLDPTSTRYGGPSGASNGYGNFLVLPLLALVGTKVKNVKLALPFLLMILLGITSSGSRLALGMASLLSVLVLFRARRGWVNGSAMVLVVAGTWFLMVLSAGVRIDVVMERFHEDFGRGEKNAIATDALKTSFSNLCFGTRADQLILGEKGEYQFSDNSYLQVACSAGVPASLVFCVCCLWVMRLRLKHESFSVWLAVAIFAITFYLNNSILWDNWIFWGSAVYWLIKHEDLQTVRARRPNKMLIPATKVLFDQLPTSN